MTETEQKPHVFRVQEAMWAPGLGRMAKSAGPRSNDKAPHVHFDLVGMLLFHYRNVEWTDLANHIDPWPTDKDGEINPDDPEVLGFDRDSYNPIEGDSNKALFRFLQNVLLNIEIMDMQDELVPGHCDFEKFIQDVNQLLAERGHADVRFVIE